MNCPETITDATKLRSVVDSALNHQRVALDLESNGFHRYPERVCLVQLAVGDSVYLIDPLAIEDLSPLGDLLSAPSVEKVFHAADYDIRSLDRDWDFRVTPLFDTSIAAAFAGHKSLGLAALLKECLNVDIPKTKKLQRADWTIRPISSELRDYAAADVRHLDHLATMLRERLDELGRVKWVNEECERLANVRYAPPDSENAFFSVKGSRDLDGKGLAILRSLHSFREREAIRRDRPPFKIFSNATMLELAAHPQSDLAQVRGIGRYRYGRAASGIRKALREGLNTVAIERPRSSAGVRPRVGVRERKAARKRLRLLKEWRLEHAEHFGIDPAIIWPAASLERLSVSPCDAGAEIRNESVRRWQRQEFGESLTAFIHSQKLILEID